MTKARLESVFSTMTGSAALSLDRTVVSSTPTDLGPVLERFRTGDQDALAELYDLVGAELFAYATWFTGNRNRAEDVVQEVFLRLARLRPTHPVARARAYLLTITRRVSIDLAHHEKRHQAEVLGADLFDPIATDPEARADARSASRALAALPSTQREAVALRYLVGLSWAEVGRVTGVSLFTAASRGRLGLVRLRRTLRLEDPR